MTSDGDGDEADTELRRALLYVHDQLGLGASKHQDLSAHVYALTEALIGAGVVKLADLEKRRADAREQMMESARAQWEGAEVLAETTDKYTVSGPAIDCASRTHLCKAACCRLDFALSRQDLAEGVVRWDVHRPYRIRRKADGSCQHSDPATKACGVHAQRPLVCRRYDCRQDARIWEDFEKRIPNGKLAALP